MTGTRRNLPRARGRALDRKKTPEPILDAPVRWLRFLARWSLATGLVTIVLAIVIFGGIGLQASDNALGAEYADLLHAARAPGLYRLGWTLDALVWLMIGGGLLALAGTLSRHAPIRAALVAACGIAQAAGSLGSLTRLGGIGDLGALYATAGPEDQALLLESYRDLWRVIDPQYHLGTLLQGVGFSVAAWAALSLRGFPRWLAVWLALPGVLATAQFALVATGAPFGLPLNVLGVIVGNVALNGAMAVALWHPSTVLVAAAAGPSGPPPPGSGVAASTADGALAARARADDRDPFSRSRLAMPLPVSTRRAMRALVLLASFGALSALAGAALAIGANGAGVPLDYLAGSPFSSYRVPGLLLGVVVGGTQLAAAVALRARHRAAPRLAAVAGFGMLIWVFAELAILRQCSWLQTAYFGLGVAELMLVLALLGVSPSLVAPWRTADVERERR